MDYITKNDASFVKTSLIDFWLKNYTADLIANEVPFFKGNRRADLIMISNNNLLGFEIKSELDSLKNLKSQILDYKKIFDFVYVVIDKKFKFSKELAELPSQIGILVYDKEIMIKREAKKIKKFKKNDLILLLWRKDLEMLLNSKKLDLDQLQKNAQNILTVDKIKAQILNLSLFSAIYPQLSEIQLLIPNIEEQEKIYETFKFLDDKILLSENTLNLLQDIKKGLLQKMFI